MTWNEINWKISDECRTRYGYMWLVTTATETIHNNRKKCDKLKL